MELFSRAGEIEKLGTPEAAIGVVTPGLTCGL
jgi:hypothetical protein